MTKTFKEQEEEWAYQRRLHFARYCWINKHKRLQVRGEYLTWAEIFERNERISLRTYARDRMDERRQLRQQEKREVHNKSGGQTSLPL